MNFNALAIIFWILDILNLGFMEMFDTTYPLNTLFWVVLLVSAKFSCKILKGVIK